MRDIFRSRPDLCPDIFGGKPIVRNMCISVELVLSLLAQGVTPAAILEDYSDLEADDIRAYIAYAPAVIAKDTLSAVSVAESSNFLSIGAPVAPPPAPDEE